MNDVKIGEFLAQERRNKKLTQQQLADMLGISNKTILKWEQGRDLPSTSLLLPLCGILEISVNELLAGEHISEQNYRKAAEANMMGLVLEREKNIKKAKLSVFTLVMASLLFAILLIVVFLYTEVISLPIKAILISTAGVLFVTGLYSELQGRDENHISL